MNKLYKFPEAAAFGRVIAKNKIYEHGKPTAKMKKMFVDQVESITWAYKLSPTTINLPDSDSVHEIQIFTIALRTGELSSDVLNTIDKAIPSPILFELRYGGRARYAAAYKRPSEADKTKWVVSSYLQSEWLDEQTAKQELPVVLHMGSLYQTLLNALSPLKLRNDEPLDELIARIDRLRIKEREAEKIDSRMKKEKQFNRRVDLNRELNVLKQEIEKLKR